MVVGGGGGGEDKKAGWRKGVEHHEHTPFPLQPPTGHVPYATQYTGIDPYILQLCLDALLTTGRRTRPPAYPRG